MPRDRQFLYLLAFLGVGLAVTLALVGVDRWLVRPRPTELLPAVAPADDDRHVPPPWIKRAYLEMALSDAPDVRVIHAERSAFCFVVGPDVDAAMLSRMAPAAEEYADCWRGVVLCEADFAPLHPDEAALPLGAHSCVAGDFRLCGDLELIERVKPAAESIHFWPNRGSP